MGCRPRHNPPTLLLLLAVLHHAGAIEVDLVVAPGMLRLRLFVITVAQRILPGGAHLIFRALREARRCKGGNREPQRQRRSPVCIPTDHHRSPSNAPHEPRQRTRADIVGRNGSASMQACRSQGAGTFTKPSCHGSNPWNICADHKCGHRNFASGRSAGFAFGAPPPRSIVSTSACSQVM